ncbi:MAG: HAMP domain-containing protein [Akkermansiaceae bacterium]|nr:HAMP domain-containing protein [Akkermansiaceae bacterium]
MYSIRNRVLGALILTGLIPLGVLFFLSDSQVGRAIKSSEFEKIEQINRALGSHVAELMEGAAHDLRSLQTNRFLSDTTATAEARLSEMRRLVGIYEVFSDISLYDREGYLITSTTSAHPEYREYTDWFKSAVAGEVAIARPHREVGKEGLHLSVYLPVLAEGGKVENVILARLKFDRISRLVRSVSLGERGRVVLVDSWGKLLSDESDARLLDDFNDDWRLDRWIQAPTGIYTDLSGVRHLYSAEILTPAETRVGRPWVLIATQPLSEVQALMSRSKAILLGVTVLTMFVAWVLGYYVSERLSRPLVELSRTARRVAAGDLEVRADGDGSLEARDLAYSFNQMVADLKDHRGGLERLVQSRTESLRRSQEELEKTGAQLKAALDCTGDGFIAEDAEGRVILVSQGMLGYLGMASDQISGRSMDRVLEQISALGESPDNVRDILNRAHDSDLSHEGVIELSAPRRRVLGFHVAPIRGRNDRDIGKVWSLWDLTEEYDLRDSLRQAQKMEAVGQLAGGVAHDFNNLLTGIMGNLSIVQMELAEARAFRSRENLRFALQAGERASELVKQLLGFSRRSHMNLKPCAAGEVVREVRDLLAASIDPSIELSLDLQDDAWMVMADSNLLSQVLMNMAVNAKDAMSGGGRIVFRAANRIVGDDERRFSADAKPGEFLCLSVEDNGDGIPPEIQSRIFEPFFTTKEQGKGTGLGLATCFGIAKQLGGWISFQSTAGKGTRFDIFLPRSIVAEAQPRVEQSAP